MKLRIINTTDGKYIGETFDKAAVEKYGTDFVFIPDKIQDLGGGVSRYSNSNYIIEAEVING